MIRTYAVRLATFLLMGALLGACTEPGPQQPEIVIPGPGEQIIYSKHIQPIFTRSCGGSGCHLHGEKPQGLALDTWVDVVLQGSEVGAVVVPYASGKSHLFQHINVDTTLGPIADPHMPLGRDPLPREQILLIRRWIDEGAKNDAGDVAFSGNRPRLFVTNQSEDKVAVIDLASRHVARYVDVGVEPGSVIPESPHNVTLSPDGRYFYVNLIKSGTVEKYDAVTFAKLGTAQVGSSPAQIAVTSDGSTLYVSNFDLSGTQRFIVRIDAASMGTTQIPDVGLAPHGVTLGADERFLYTTNVLGDNVSEIDLTTMEVTRRFPLAWDVLPIPQGPAKYEPYQSILDPDGNRLWVTCRASGEVRVIDIALGKVVDSVTVGKRPLIPAITPNGAELWVPNQGSDNVSIVSTATRSVIGTIPDLKGQPHAVVFAFDGGLAFVSCENQTGSGELHHPLEGGSIPGIVYVIDVATRQVRQQIEVGSFAAGLAVHPFF